jgi:hypothetical protein
MPQSLLLAMTCVSLLNEPFDGFRLPPSSPVVLATASGEITSANATDSASTHLTLPPCLPLKGWSCLNI